MEIREFAAAEFFKKRKPAYLAFVERQAALLERRFRPTLRC
jgi:hypothetical protein